MTSVVNLSWTAACFFLNFYTLFNEEAPFYWVNFNLGGFFIYVLKYAGGWLEFHLIAHALPGRLVI